MEKPQIRSFYDFFEKVMTVKTKMGIVWYREVYPNLIVANRGCSKTFGDIPPRI